MRHGINQRPDEDIASIESGELPAGINRVAGKLGAAHIRRNLGSAADQGISHIGTDLLAFLSVHFVNEVL